MTTRDRTLCACYGLFAVAGTVTMAWLAIAYIVAHLDDGLLGVVGDFLRDASANSAAVFIYADLTLAWVVLAVFMVVEARRHGIRHVWAYIVGAPLLALCVSFPVFMFVRQLKIGSGTTRGLR